jgi:hypothetical protein
MENLEKNELVQLITFYKQKLSDTELDLLKLQLEINKLNSVILSSAQSQQRNLSKNKNGVFIDCGLDIHCVMVYN